MRFCSFIYRQQRTFGFELQGGRFADLREAGKLLAAAGRLAGGDSKLLDGADLKSYLSHGKAAIEAAERISDLLAEDANAVAPAVHPLKDIRLLPPIPNPSKIIAIGLNYRDHAEEQGVPLPENPLVFAKFPNTLIGPEDEIKLPAISKQVDPEAELCVVILQRAKKLTPEEAANVIAGYTVGNDVSARDLQFSDKQWVRGKSCDTFAPCGPCLVTPDEVGDPHRLEISLKLNGKVQQDSSTSNLIFNCYTLVSYISQGITLEPGDIIFTGTPAGVGVFRDPPVFLKPGDVVEVTIEKLGTLRNPVAAG